MTQILRRTWTLDTSIQQSIQKSLKMDINNANLLVSLFDKELETTYISRYLKDFYENYWESYDVQRAYQIWKRLIKLNENVFNRLRDVKNSNKIGDVITRNYVENELRKCKTDGEVRNVLRTYQVGKRQESEMAKLRKLGLEKPAMLILQGKTIDVRDYVSSDLKSRDVTSQLEKMMAHVINNDEKTNQFLDRVANSLEVQDPRPKNHRGKQKDSNPPAIEITVKSKLTERVQKELNKIRKEEERKQAEKREERKKKEKMGEKEEEEEEMKDPLEKEVEKYAFFTKYDKRLHNVQSYHVLGLDRVECRGIATWEVEVKPKGIKYFHPFQPDSRIIQSKWQQIYRRALSYSITDLFIPKLIRETKKVLQRKAENDSLANFSINLHHFFRQQGIKSTYIIALDPGYAFIKCAFLDPNGKVLGVDEFRIYTDRFGANAINQFREWSRQTEGKPFEFGIGNGTNCFNTKLAVERMIDENVFESQDIFMRDVPEDGSSKYSVTALAREEFPTIPVKLISAISIGRRLLNPVSEYVKIPPENLGKGTYQHSVERQKLKEQLDVVVRDLVSLRGVDLNTASKHLLQKVCGLDKNEAVEIVNYRNNNGPFRSRNQLKRVRGMTEKKFELCSGFLTIQKPDNWCGYSRLDEWHPFDSTTLHPSQYRLAEALFAKLGLEIMDALDITKVVNIARIFNEQLNSEEEKLIKILTEEFKLNDAPKKYRKVEKQQAFSKGDTVQGHVKNKAAFGIFVEFGHSCVGLCSVKHYTDDRGNVDMPETGTTDLSFYIEDIFGDDDDIKYKLVPVPPKIDPMQD